MPRPQPIQLLSNAPPTEENTPDLTDEEVAKATPTQSAADFGEQLKNLRCASCGAPIVKQAHKRCLRAPHFYSRAKGTCPNGHTEAWVFLVDWLRV
jgi:hypothetical protein